MNKNQNENIKSEIIVNDWDYDDFIPLIEKDISNYTQTPKDRYWAVYFSFYFLGITSLLPMNFILMSDTYWMYKFRDVNDENFTVDLANTTHIRNKFQAEFTSNLSIVQNVTSTSCIFLNIIIAKWIHLNTRMTVSLIFTLCFFSMQLIFVYINTDSWQMEFMALVFILVIFMNAFRTMYQCSFYSIVGFFPPSYMSSATAGQGFGSLVAAIGVIISIASTGDKLKSSIVYFLIGSGSLLISVCLRFFVLSNSNFYKFYAKMEPTRNGKIEKMQYAKLQMGQLWKKVWIFQFTLMLTWGVTMSILPPLIVLAQPNPNHESILPQKYYIPVVGFFTFAIGDYLGRTAAGVFQWTRKPENKNWLFVISLFRILFIPIILLCNLQPRSHLPILFSSDTLFGLVIHLLGFSNGYLTTAIFILSPQVVDTEYKGRAMDLVVLGLGGGITCGVLLSGLLVRIL